MKGDFYTNIFTGGEEYQVRVDKANDIYFIYRLSDLEDEENVLLHTSCCKDNMEAYIEDMYFANVDYDFNL